MTDKQPITQQIDNTQNTASDGSTTLYALIAEGLKDIDHNSFRPFSEAIADIRTNRVKKTI